MANTLEAPVKKSPKQAGKSPFGKPKAPEQIIYELLEKNDRRMRDDTPIYPPYIEFPNKDTILWNYGTEDQPDWAERVIRFLPGFESIFVDEQEKDGRIIPENILNNRANKFIINKGHIKVRPAEKQKIKFLDMCNRNGDSPYRTGKVKAIFARKSEEKTIQETSTKQLRQQDAFAKAFNATESQIAFHAKYLGIPLVLSDTNASRTLIAVQTDYRQKALDDPDGFLKTFDDQDLKVKYQIERALEDNFLSTVLIPGKLALVSTKEEIMELPNGTKGLIDEIFVYCQSQEGEKLADKLRERE
jgi:hypothetical protein